MAHLFQIFTPASTPQRQCRICLEEKQEEDNPLISPSCECKGTIAVIHQDCLLAEISSKSSGFLINFNCSVCKNKIKIYTIRQLHSILHIVWTLLWKIMFFILSTGLAYWMLKNQKRYAKRLWGYPQIQIYNKLAILVSIIAFVMFFHVVGFLINGFYTGRRRIKFQVKK